MVLFDLCKSFVHSGNVISTVHDDAKCCVKKMFKLGAKYTEMHKGAKRAMRGPGDDYNTYLIIRCKRCEVSRKFYDIQSRIFVYD